MFKPAKLRERQCIAIKANGEQCSGDIGKGALRQATRQTGKLVGATDDRAIILDIINLLICGRHGAANIEYQLDFFHKDMRTRFSILHDCMNQCQTSRFGHRQERSDDFDEKIERRYQAQSIFTRHFVRLYLERTTRLCQSGLREEWM